MLPHVKDERFLGENPPSGAPKSYPLFEDKTLDDDILRAVQAKDLSTVKRLISQGAVANSAFETAVADGLHDIVIYLISEGADTNFSRSGVLPLHHAVLGSDLRMVEILLSSPKTEKNPLSTKYSKTAIELARHLHGARADPVLKYLLEINQEA